MKMASKKLDLFNSHFFITNFSLPLFFCLEFWCSCIVNMKNNSNVSMCRARTFSPLPSLLLFCFVYFEMWIVLDDFWNIHLFPYLTISFGDCFLPLPFILTPPQKSFLWMLFLLLFLPFFYVCIVSFFWRSQKVRLFNANVHDANFVVLLPSVRLFVSFSLPSSPFLLVFTIAQSPFFVIWAVKIYFFVVFFFNVLFLFTKLKQQ